MGIRYSYNINEKDNTTDLSVSDKGIFMPGLSVSDKGIFMPGLSVSDKGVCMPGLSVSDKGVCIPGLSVSDKGVNSTNQIVVKNNNWFNFLQYIFYPFLGYDNYIVNTIYINRSDKNYSKSINRNNCTSISMNGNNCIIERNNNTISVNGNNCVISNNNVNGNNYVIEKNCVIGKNNNYISVNGNNFVVEKKNNYIYINNILTDIQTVNEQMDIKIVNGVIYINGNYIDSKKYIL
jgi:hypothetical protein